MNHNSLLLGTIIIFLSMGTLYAFVSPKASEKMSAKFEANTVDTKADNYTDTEEEANVDIDNDLENYKRYVDDDDDYEEKDEYEDDDYLGPPTLVSDPKPDPVETTKTGYTIQDVVTHSTEQSCWTAVDGKVYDLTSFIANHPGGKANIMKICGVDGSAVFGNKHGGESRPKNTLDGLYIGPLI